MSWVRTAAAQPAGHTLILPRPTLNPHTIRPHTHSHTLAQTKRTRTHASTSTYHNRSYARHCLRVIVPHDFDTVSCGIAVGRRRIPRKK